MAARAPCNSPEERIELGDADSIILAVPAWVARTLVPDLTAPTEYRSISNIHFKIAPPTNLPKIIGIINATTEWLFAFDNRLSGDGQRRRSF